MNTNPDAREMPMNDDRYGSVLRDSLKKSMEYPFSNYKPQMVRSSALIIFFVVILVAGVSGFYLFDKLEGLFR